MVEIYAAQPTGAKDARTKGQAATDPLAASMACNLARIAKIQWAESESTFPLNFDPLQLPRCITATSTAAPTIRLLCFQIYRWFGSHFAYLLDKLASVKRGASVDEFRQHLEAMLLEDRGRRS